MRIETIIGEWMSSPDTDDVVTRELQASLRRLGGVAVVSGIINLLTLSGSLYMLQVADRDAGRYLDRVDDRSHRAAIQDRGSIRGGEQCPTPGSCRRGAAECRSRARARNDRPVRSALDAGERTLAAGEPGRHGRLCRSGLRREGAALRPAVSRAGR